MRLADLNPRFVGAGGEGVSDKNGNPVPRRSGVGITFDCPCGCGDRVFASFDNPIDGGPPLGDARPLWSRTGESFDEMTLRPSILRIDGCGWHGWITNGEISSA